jgi:hypothetical protein
MKKTLIFAIILVSVVKCSNPYRPPNQDSKPFSEIPEIVIAKDVLGQPPTKKTENIIDKKRVIENSADFIAGFEKFAPVAYMDVSGKYSV